MQAASPSYEISKLFKLTGDAHMIVNYLSILIISLSFIGILFSLLNNINDRKYDLAILRTLGFTKRKVFSLILIEGMSISLLGSVFGIIIGCITYISVQYFSLIGRNMTSIQYDFVFDLFAVWLIVIVVSFLTCLIPCIKVYKRNIRSILLNS